MFHNRNVFLTILFNFIDGACFSVWSAQLLPVLLNKYGGSTTVGWCAAASGIAQAIGGLIAGSAADRLPREDVIRVGAFCGIVATAATMVAINLLAIPALYITQSLWGVYLGLVSTASEALFADSVASGHRTFIYTIKWIVQTLCYCVGYTVALVSLLLLGNELSTHSIQIVMTVGLSVHPVAHILLFWLRDRNALQQDGLPIDSSDEVEEDNDDDEDGKNEKVQSWSVEQQKEADVAYAMDAPLLMETTALPNERSDLLQNRNSSGIRYGARRSPSESLVSEASCSSRLRRFKDILFSNNSVPYAVCFTDFLMAVGSGISIQYIPLFFVNNYNITPAWLLGAFILNSSGSAVCATVVRYISEHYMGRLSAVICVRILGTTCSLMLALAQGPLAHLGVLLAFFIVRSASMNSTNGITRSVIMDCVKKGNRAKWSALESVYFFIWSISATIGGYIVKAKGYQFAFLVTAIVHFAGILSLVPAAIAARPMEERLLREKALKREKGASQ